MFNFYLIKYILYSVSTAQSVPTRFVHEVGTAKSSPMLPSRSMPAFKNSPNLPASRRGSNQSQPNLNDRPPAPTPPVTSTIPQNIPKKSNTQAAGQYLRMNPQSKKIFCFFFQHFI